MPPVAPVTPPLWSVTLRSLRELSRLAVAALVLSVGLGGSTVAPSPAPAAPATVPAVADTRVDRPQRAVEQETEQAVDIAAPLPAGAGVATPAIRLAAPAPDPGRGVPARRGPPTV